MILFLMACSGEKSALESTKTSKLKQPISSSKSQDLLFYQDKDGDGYGNTNATPITKSAKVLPPEGYVQDNTDCDDNDKKVYPRIVDKLPGMIGWDLMENEIDGRKDIDCDGVYYWLAQTETIGLEVRTTSWDSTLKRLTTLLKVGGVLTTSEFSTYDDFGHLLTYENFSGITGSTAVSSHKRTYDQKGNLLIYEAHRGPLTSPITFLKKYTYNSLGKKLTEEEEGPSAPAGRSSKKFIYDDKGNLITIEFRRGGLGSDLYTAENILYDNEGNKLSSESSYYSRFRDKRTYDKRTYDNKGNEITHEMLDDHFPHLNRFLKSTYDSEGNLIRRETRHGSPDGPIDVGSTYSVEYTFNDRKQPLSIIHLYPSSNLHTYNFTYNEQGRLLTKSAKSGEGEWHIWEQSTYDDNDNPLTYEEIGDHYKLENFIPITQPISPPHYREW